MVFSKNTIRSDSDVNIDYKGNYKKIVDDEDIRIKRKNIVNIAKSKTYFTQDKIRVPFGDFVELVNKHNVTNFIKKIKENDEENKEENKNTISRDGEVFLDASLLAKLTNTKEKEIKLQVSVLWLPIFFTIGFLVGVYNLLNGSNGKFMLFGIFIAFSMKYFVNNFNKFFHFLEDHVKKSSFYISIAMLLLCLPLFLYFALFYNP